ncbi:MAG: redoxin domain-containing protein [Nitrospiraceae bacterium]|nr:redoxin domain-containing protein [Nitrospiraceae bacterium]
MPLNRIFLLLLVILAPACGNMRDDLFPSGADRRPAVQEGTIGPEVGQQAPDFTISDSLGNTVTLSETAPQFRAVVLYFTMWCPICDSHMSHMRDSIIPLYPDVRFFAVDYVSGSVAAARDAQISNGYGGSPFTVLADTQQTVLGTFHATMGTTVVIDRTGILRMNEDFKDGTRLTQVLDALP